MHYHIDPVERAFEELVIGLELERVRHDTRGIRDHAIRGDDGITFEFGEDGAWESFHSALSYEHAGKIEAQLQAEVAELMAKAEAADAADIPDGMSIPDELARREERLRKIAEARTNIEARAKERHAREMAEYEAALATPRLRPRAKSPAASRPSSNRGASAERSD